MKSIYKTEDIVRDVLKEYPSARDNDFILLFYYCKKTNPELLQQSLGYVLMMHKHYGLTPIATITRARRKLQAKDILLASSKKIQKLKKEQEEYYVFYSKN